MVLFELQDNVMLNEVEIRSWLVKKVIIICFKVLITQPRSELVGMHGMCCILGLKSGSGVLIETICTRLRHA
jgi:hypothetical protein